MSYTSAELPDQPSRFSNDPDEKRAGVWAHKQKMLYKNDRLSQKKIDELNAVEGWTWDIEKK